MVSMKMSDEERSEYNDTVMSGQPLYPWGLCINLDDDSLKKLGIEKLPELDQVMEMKIKVQVTSVNSRKESNDEDESSCSMQITDMEMVESGSKDAAQKLYGDKK